MGEEAKSFNGKGTYPFQVFTEITLLALLKWYLEKCTAIITPPLMLHIKSLSWNTLPYLTEE